MSSIVDRGSFGLGLRSGVSVALRKSHLFADTEVPLQSGGESLSPEDLCHSYKMEHEQGISQETGGLKLAGQWLKCGH